MRQNTNVPKKSTCFIEFEAGVSTGRLQPYGLGIDPPEDVCARYLGNVALSESLYSSLNYFEIALRNAIHAAATRYFNTPTWFDTVTNHRGQPLWWQVQQRQLAAAKQKLIAANKPQTCERIVAELTFGFWTAVFNQSYERALSVHIIRPIFPSMPRADRTRAQIETRLDDIRDLRNRVFHHEPIWRRPLPAEHGEIFTILGQMNPTVYAHARVVDRFMAIWGPRELPYRVKYRSWYAGLKP